MKRLPPIAALTVFLVHLVANPHYGFFRDELYFIICGRHPQWGYVDQPPVVPLLAAATQMFGHSLVALRAIPALFAAGGAYVVCLLATEFGGRTFAQLLAVSVYFFTPVLANFGMKVSPDEVGLLTWPLLALLLARLARGADARLWIVIGIVAGLSLESKYAVIFFFAAMLAGLLATPQRRILSSAWFLGGALVAALIALPNLIWQLHYGLPMLELLRNGQTGKNVIAGPATYALQELLITNPLLAAVWIIGVLWLLRRPALRWLGIAYGVLILEMIVLHGKHYYPADVYPIVIAAGAVPIERWTARFALARVAVVAYAVVAGCLIIPDALPVLPEPVYIAYAQLRERVSHISSKATETEHGRENSLLPGDWADMHGWPEMAAAARAAYESLGAGERRTAVVFAGNYGEASAVAFFAPDVPVVSEHNQYWLWGPRGYSGSPLVQINGSCFASLKLYAAQTRVATVGGPYAISYERNIPVWICRSPRGSLAGIWPSIKAYE